MITHMQKTEPEYCHACLEKMTILCALCEKPIFIGAPVSIAETSDEKFVLPKGAVACEYDPLKFITCLRPTCSEPFYLSGYWHPPGIVHNE